MDGRRRSAFMLTKRICLECKNCNIILGILRHDFYAAQLKAKRPKGATFTDRHPVPVENLLPLGWSRILIADKRSSCIWFCDLLVDSGVRGS